MTERRRYNPIHIPLSHLIASYSGRADTSPTAANAGGEASALRITRVMSSAETGTNERGRWGDDSCRGYTSPIDSLEPAVSATIRHNYCTQHRVLVLTRRYRLDAPNQLRGVQPLAVRQNLPPNVLAQQAARLCREEEIWECVNKTV